MRTTLLLIALLWSQLFLALVPTWRFGEYYNYGWFVPFLAAALAWRRWQMLAPTSLETSTPARANAVFTALAVLAILAIIPLRLIASADPGWRPPLLLHVLLVFGFSHLLLWLSCGRRVSLGFLPVTIFALSAVPYPWRIEQEFIRSLTGKVIGITAEIFLLTGRPVEIVGERLTNGADVVEVTEGCSGIRSFQSLVMVALFFGELFFLSFGRRIGLVALAALSAVVFNTLRAYLLAHIHFTTGFDAAEAAHDGIGHAAFLLSAGALWLSAYALLHLGGRRRKVLRRTIQAPPIRDQKSEVGAWRTKA